MSQHNEQAGANVHVPYAWEYDDETAREGATGFVSADVGKLARQLDDNSLWLLSAVTPTWVAVGGGGSAGALVLLEQHTASSSTSLDFTTCISVAYDEYLIEFLNIIPATDQVNLIMRCSTNGGSSYDSGSNYSTVPHYFYTGGDALSGGASDGATAMNVADTVDNGSTFGVSGCIRLFSPGSSTLYKAIVGQINSWHGSLNKLIGFNIVGTYKVATAVNAFRFLFSSGNIASGTIRVYGIAKT